MLKKSINITSLTIKMLFLIVIGIIILISKEQAINIIIKIIAIYLLISSIITFTKYIINFKEKTTRNLFLIYTLSDLVGGIIILLFPNIVIQSIALCFTIYLSIHTIINIISYWIHYHYKIKGRLRILLTIIIQLFIFIPITINEDKNIEFISIIIGIYFILYGVSQIRLLIPRKKMNYIKKSINIPLPVLLCCFIPRKLITLINDLVQTDEDILTINNSDNNPDIFILIHLANNGSAAMGHVEIGYKGKIYSYGNYDMTSRKLFNTIGDGIILECNKEKYINYIVNKKDRFIVEFGLSLNNKEKELVEKRIKELLVTDTSLYLPIQQLYDMENKNIICTDMSSEIYRYANGIFHKINKGKYKKFFVLKTNCAFVSQYILSSIGNKIITIHGIITPGTYYDYLNECFKLKTTNVVSRKIYTKYK